MNNPSPARKRAKKMAFFLQSHVL